MTVIPNFQTDTLPEDASLNCWQAKSLYASVDSSARSARATTVTEN